MIDLLSIQHDGMTFRDERVIFGGVGDGLLRLKASLAVDHALQQAKLLLLLIDLQGQQVTALLSQFTQAAVGT